MLSPVQSKILSSVSKGADIDKIAFDLYGGEDEPDYSYDAIRVQIFRMRKKGFVISNSARRLSSGKTGRGTKAFYNLVSTPEGYNA